MKDLIVVVKVIIFVIREVFGHLAKTGELLLHVDAGTPASTCSRRGDAVGVQHLVEVGDHKTFRVEVCSASSVLDALNAC